MLNGATFESVAREWLEKFSPSLVLALLSPGDFWSELSAPKSDRFIANEYAPLRRLLPGLNKSLIPLIGDRNALRFMVDDEISSADIWRIWPANDEREQLQSLLRDRMTMAVGIEGRVPMLDQRIVEFGLNLPIQYKFRFFRGGKYWLKKVPERYLSKSTVWRKKKGLPIPVSEWTGMQSKIDQKLFFLNLWQRENSK